MRLNITGKAYEQLDDFPPSLFWETESPDDVGGTPSKHLSDSGRKTVLKASAIVKSKGGGGGTTATTIQTPRNFQEPERIRIDNHPTDSRAVESGDGPDDDE